VDLDEKRGAREMKTQAPSGKYQLSASTIVGMLWLIAGVAHGPALTWAQHVDATRPSAPAIGALAVDFEVKLLDGKSVSLKQLRGKPAVINFFASWCDPCRDEIPLINELAANADKAGYQVIGIAVEDTRAAVMQFTKEANVVFPVALDLNSTVKRAYRIFGPPATFFIDAQGTVRDIVLGSVTAERAREALKKAGVS